jgi:hypothetical protein
MDESGQLEGGSCEEFGLIIKVSIFLVGDDSVLSEQLKSKQNA